MDETMQSQSLEGYFKYLVLLSGVLMVVFSLTFLLPNQSTPMRHHRVQRIPEDTCLLRQRSEVTSLVYNMVPKCGSFGFRTVIYSMAKKHEFRTLKYNYHRPPQSIMPYHLSEQSVDILIQERFWNKREPWLFSGHLHYINFTAAGYPMNPSYINIVRDPIDRLVSFYYFRRTEPKHPYTGPLEFVIKSENKEDKDKRMKRNFNKCVEIKDIECTDSRIMFGVIPHFCGQDPMCTTPSDHALEQAKRNAVNAFDVIGYLEKYEEFIQVVEYMFPQFFKGALKVYHNISNKPSVRHQSAPIQASNLTRSILMQRQDIQLEYEFYKFVKKEFDCRYKSLNICKAKNNIDRHKTV